MKSYGRAPTILMATGYEQVRSVVATLAGDMAAADDVRLVLPETGVCEGVGHDIEEVSCCVGPASQAVLEKSQAAEAAFCCGGLAKDDPASCCDADAIAKISGKMGCGCGNGTNPAAS